ncbi:hypothetical protein O181_051676 [Austropuccinia psidii MF-1]|uniref:Uncharacterized protein n=1 Tax=Austropuccinia psidii MF-1 TaxID=1389203 RepID=A0A9Q3HNJ2_9BASI|nr:hypothetical protein [Austropuccinia psidii MF-1]
MPIQHSPAARQTRPQSRAQAVLTPNPRALLDSTPAVPQLRAQYGRRSTIQEGRLSTTSFKGPGEYGEEEEEESVEEEESDGTEGLPAPVGESQGTGEPTIAHSNLPVSHKSEPSLLAIMQQITQIMANLQEASSLESSRPPAFKTLSMKEPKLFDGTQPFKARRFIQSCQLIFHNDLGNCCQTGRKSFMPLHFLLAGMQNGLSLIFPISIIKTRATFSALGNCGNLISLIYFGDPNEVRKAEADSDSLIIKEGGHVSLYIADFRSLVSRIGDRGERALIQNFRKGFPSRILDQFSSHPSKIYSLKDLMDITLEREAKREES